MRPRSKPRIATTDVIRQEMLDQLDPNVRARRLAQYLARTADKIWQEQDNGEWLLVPLPTSAAA